MASAITCNFPTWCASFHCSACEQWKIVSSVPHCSVQLKCTNSFSSTEWHIWKCSLPGSRNVCRCLVSWSVRNLRVTETRNPSAVSARWHWTSALNIWPKYINMSLQEETTPKLQHLFLRCAFLCHFSTDPYKPLFPFCILFSRRVRNYRSTIWLQNCTVCVCQAGVSPSELLKERELLVLKC